MIVFYMKIFQNTLVIEDKFYEEDDYMDRKNQMKYIEALMKLFEVMQGRPDILEVKFDRENDSFDVITKDGIHVCFCNEFI